MGIQEKYINERAKSDIFVTIFCITVFFGFCKYTIYMHSTKGMQTFFELRAGKAIYWKIYFFSKKLKFTLP